MAVKNTTQVLIDGKIITLGGYESPEYLQKVAAYLNQKISELSQSAGYNRLSVDTKHTLLALNIADDYFKAKSQVDTLEEDMEAKDRETYDMKHDLIAAEIQAGDLKKELEERDRLCVGFMKLQQFTQESLRTNGIAAKQSAKVSEAEPVDDAGRLCDCCDNREGISLISGGKVRLSESRERVGIVRQERTVCGCFKIQRLMGWTGCIQSVMCMR